LSSYPRTPPIWEVKVTTFFGMLSMLGSIGAGLYLLSTHAAGSNSYLEAIAHGMGVYFIARGLFMGPSLFQQAGYRTPPSAAWVEIGPPRLAVGDTATTWPGGR